MKLLTSSLPIFPITYHSHCQGRTVRMHFLPNPSSMLPEHFFNIFASLIQYNPVLAIVGHSTFVSLSTSSVWAHTTAFAIIVSIIPLILVFKSFIKILTLILTYTSVRDRHLSRHRNISALRSSSWRSRLTLARSSASGFFDVSRPVKYRSNICGDCVSMVS